MFTHYLRRCFSVAMLILLAAPALAGSATATQPPDEGTFTLGAFTAFCEPGYFGPFVDCTPWTGVTVTFTTNDGSFTDSCVTSGTDRAAGCTVDVPFGATVTASIDPAAIPAGYVLERTASLEITVPDGPAEGVFSGPAFVLFQQDGPPVEESPVENGFLLPANTAFCDPGYMGPFVGCTPWEGVTVSFVSSDGMFSASCVTSGAERAAGCTVEAPFGATVVASIDPAAIPAGYVLEGDTSVEIAVPAGPPDGVFSGATFVLLPVSPSGEPGEGMSPIEPAGLPAAIYAGSCDAPLPADPVAQLEDASEATGPQVGFAGAVPVAIAYTEVGVPFATLTDGNHLLAIFNADVLVACGGVGGLLDDSGALSVGLEPVDEREYPAVAYITPLDDGSRSSVTVFVMMPVDSGE